MKGARDACELQSCDSDRDPDPRSEVKYLANGTAVTEISLAINRQFTDRNTNERKEDVTFVEVTLWSRLAELAGNTSPRPQRDDRGRLQLDSWEDKQSGQKRSSFASSVRRCSSSAVLRGLVAAPVVGRRRRWTTRRRWWPWESGRRRKRWQLRCGGGEPDYYSGSSGGSGPRTTTSRFSRRAGPTCCVTMLDLPEFSRILLHPWNLLRVLLFRLPPTW